VHLPSRQSRHRKAMCGIREALIEVRTKLINAVRGWSRAQGLGRIRTGAPTTFPHRAREHVTKAEHEVPAYLVRALSSIEQLNLQIVQADQELEQHAAEDADCQLLMTAPGVGPVTAVRFTAAVDDVTRFPSAHKLQSYLGLTPGEDSSSGRKKRTALTKAGPKKLRWALVQAAWVARRYYKDDPLIQWSFEVEKRRGKKVAVVALARRLAGVLYAMWWHRKRYDRNHAKTVTSTPRAALTTA
jgi:transposase